MSRRRGQASRFVLPPPQPREEVPLAVHKAIVDTQRDMSARLRLVESERDAAVKRAEKAEAEALSWRRRIRFQGA